MSTWPDPARWGAVEIGIRGRPRFRVVLDLGLRARHAYFHSRALCSNFGGGRKTGALGIGRATDPKILFLNDIIFPKKCDDGIRRNLQLEICCLCIYIYILMWVCAHSCLASWDRTGRCESGDIQASGIKWKCVPGSWTLRVVLLYDPVLQTKWYIMISRTLSTFEWQIHTYVRAVCDSTCEGDDDTDLCNMLATTELYPVGLHTQLGHACLDRTGL